MFNMIKVPHIRHHNYSPQNLLAARSARQQSAVSFRTNGPVSFMYTREYIEMNDIIADRAIFIPELVLCVHMSDMRYADRRLISD